MSSYELLIDDIEAHHTASHHVRSKSSCLCLSILGVTLVASSKTIFLESMGSHVKFLGRMALAAGISMGMCFLDDHKLGSGSYNTLSKRSSIAYYCAIGLLANDLVWQHSPVKQSVKDVSALMTFGAVISIALPVWAVTRARAHPSNHYATLHPVRTETSTSGVGRGREGFGTGTQR